MSTLQVVSVAVLAAVGYLFALKGARAYWGERATDIVFGVHCYLIALLIVFMSK